MPALTDLDVLIVDDHAGMRVMLRAVLERAGAVQAREAANATQALALITERAPNLILLDQRMPEMNGLELIARLRADARCAASRIIVITGHIDANFREAAKSAGADMVLGKPVSPRDLLAAIEAVFA